MGEKAERALFCLGGAFVCAALLLPMGKDGLRREADPHDAVAVFSEAVLSDGEGAKNGELREDPVQREQLSPPGEKKTYAEAEEWSVFDEIGELFAELLFGERK